MLRAAIKIQKRRQAQLYITDHDMWRPWILHLILTCRSSLRALKRPETVSSNLFYTEGDDPGLGKNILMEADRAVGEAAYTSALRRYALQVLCAEIYRTT
jgi:hypothetical protein